MHPFLPYVFAVATSVLTVVGFHFLTRHHVAQAAESKSVHLICSECKILVARFKQMEDSTIKCVNCIRRAERIC